MATYIDLHTLRGSDTLSPLKQKIAVAIAIKANVIAKSVTPTATAKAWAISALANPETYLDTVINYIIADNNTATTAAITGASDALVQTAVNAAVDTLMVG